MTNNIRRILLIIVASYITNNSNFLYYYSYITNNSNFVYYYSYITNNIRSESKERTETLHVVNC